MRKVGFSFLITRSPFKQFMAGSLVTVVFSVILRLVIGDRLPSFIPQEESAKPGFLLGMAAGYGEEVYFRMLLTPLVFYFAQKPLAALKQRRLSVGISATIAIVITAFSFAILHEVGEADGTVVWQIFATRFMVPGILMGSLFFLIGPGFVIFMHTSAHVMIPILFV